MKHDRGIIAAGGPSATMARLLESGGVNENSPAGVEQI
jgi:hypothetical protein